PDTVVSSTFCACLEDRRRKGRSSTIVAAMADSRFFDNHGPLSLAAIAKLTGAEIAHDNGSVVRDVAPLDPAGPGQIAFCDNAKMRAALGRTGASAVIAARDLIAAAPPGAARLVSDRPNLAFAKIASALYPSAGLMWRAGEPQLLPIDPSARIGS